MLRKTSKRSYAFAGVIALTGVGCDSDEGAPNREHLREPVDDLAAPTGTDEEMGERADGLESVEDGEGAAPAPGTTDISGETPPKAISSCIRTGQTCTFSGSGEKTCDASCGGVHFRTGGGCNLHGGHTAHAWMTDSYPLSSSSTWRCRAFHNSSDSGFQVEAWANCCRN